MEVDSQNWWEVGDRPSNKVGDCTLAPEISRRWKVKGERGRGRSRVTWTDNIMA